MKNEQVTVTPTIHILVFHVPEFCNFTKNGLGYYSTQAGEAVHPDFRKTWAQYKVSPENPDYGERILDALVWYNVKHL